MKTFYKSDITGLVYETEEECLAAEEKFKAEQKEKEKRLARIKKEREQRESERSRRAKEIETALEEFKEFQKTCSKELQDKWNIYLELRNKFIKDYGEYHTTYRISTNPLTIFSELINHFFR
ncbi:MAG: hypothetical protein J6J36_00730 [Clostridia bacterium]|nr:hypothetical protein [Clostridia bacterium]